VIVTGSDSGYGPNSLARIGQEVMHFVQMGFLLESAKYARSQTSQTRLQLGSCKFTELQIHTIESHF
jgi:hypothetical protein